MKLESISRIVCEILLSIFILLKLYNYIDWSWYIVLSPLYIGTIIAILLVKVIKWEFVVT